MSFSFEVVTAFERIEELADVAERSEQGIDGSGSDAPQVSFEKAISVGLRSGL